jgi:hypothetical protein
VRKYLVSNDVMETIVKNTVNMSRSAPNDAYEDIACDDGFEDEFEHDKLLVTKITIFFLFRFGRGGRRHR